MIKRIIEISREPAHLAVRLEQLLLLRDGQPTGSAVPSIPCEDIGLVMVDHVQTTYTHQALSKLMEHGAAVVICGRDHLPCGLLLPMSAHTEVVWRTNDQIAASKPLLKKLWQQVVVAKIKAQAANLPAGSAGRTVLLNLARDVKSGDATNIEAHAAKVYWASWLSPDGVPVGWASSLTAGQTPDANGPNDFARDQNSLDPLNVMLNYGYAVLRAAVGRTLVAAGLFPALGIHHHNRSNVFCLADDLMEPLRAMIDTKVRDWHRRGRSADGLTQPAKAFLIDVLHQTVIAGEQTGPLLVALHRYVASLVRCFQGEQRTLEIPVATE